MESFTQLMNGVGIFVVLATTIPLVLIAVFLTVIASRSRKKTQEAMRWPETMGRILISNVVTRTDSRHSTSFYPDLLYEYNVDGQTYQGTQLTPGFLVGWGMRAQAMKQIANYPVGANVPVYYNPNNPSEAVLEQRSSAAIGALSCASSFIVIMVACTVIFAVGMFVFMDQVMKFVSDVMPTGIP